jgi:hypothetical protein
VREWFKPLNPYTEKGHVFKIEDDNFSLAGGKVTDQIEPLYCYAISPKRYALFNRDAKGAPIIRKALAHGLGHLYPPLEGDAIPKGIPKPAVPLETMDIKAWQYCFWYRILLAALGGGARPKIDDLPGFDRPATTRYSASTPSILDWCKGYNRELDYRDRIKPFNFMLRFYAGLVLPPQLVGDGATRSKARPLQLRPIAPFDRNILDAATHCRDRSTGQPIDPSYLSSYAEELAPYHIHPDSKFLNGGYDDVGFTSRRHVIADYVHKIGKEADNLEGQLEHGLDPEAVTDYGIGLDGERITLARLQAGLGIAKLQRLSVASGVSRQHLIAIRDGKKTPKRTTLRRVVAGLARLKTSEQQLALDAGALLERARKERDRIGLRKLAGLLKVDHSTLAQTLNQQRPLSAALHGAMEKLFEFE